MEKAAFTATDFSKKVKLGNAKALSKSRLRLGGSRSMKIENLVSAEANEPDGVLPCSSVLFREEMS